MLYTISAFILHGSTFLLVDVVTEMFQHPLLACEVFPQSLVFRGSRIIFLLHVPY